MPLQTWAYARDGDRWVVRYQLRGDQQMSEVAVTPRLDRIDGQWRLTALDQASPALWDLEGLRLVEGTHSLVLGAADASSLQAWADAADRAVATVDSVWGTEWSRRLVLVLPQEWTQVSGLLGGRAYPGYAGLTTSLDPAGRGAGQRILLNPDETARLSQESRALLVAHEATHVATEGLPGVPLWVAEGLAEYVAYADSTNSARDALPVLLRAARSGSLPAELPTDSHFAAGGDTAEAAYEGAHLAVRLLAEAHGDAALVAAIRAIAERPAELDQILTEQLGIDLAQLTAAWQTRIRDLADA